MPGFRRVLALSSCGALLIALLATAVTVEAARARGSRKRVESPAPIKSGQLTPAALDQLIDAKLLGATTSVTGASVTGTSVDASAATTVPAALWLRRAALEICGSVPDADALASLGAAPDEAARRRALERLFGQKGYAERWGRILARPMISFLREHEPFRRRLEAYFVGAMQSRASWRAIARGLLTAEGSSEESPAIGFYLQFVDARAEIAARVGTGLMGVRLACAQCHDHPYARWTMQDYYGTAAFFGNTSTYGLPRDLYRAYRDARKGKAAEVEMVVGPGQDRAARLKRLERMQGVLAKLDQRSIEGTSARRAGASARVAPVARSGRPAASISRALAAQDAAVVVDERPRGAQAVADAIARGELPVHTAGRKSAKVSKTIELAKAPDARMADLINDNVAPNRPKPVKLTSLKSGAMMGDEGMSGGSMSGGMMSGGAMSGGPAKGAARVGPKGLDLDSIVYLIVDGGGGGFTVPYEVAGDDLPAGLKRSLAPGTHVAPRLLGSTVAEKSGRRSTFATWLTQPGNPYFARSLVNRVWAEVFGRGLVEPVNALDGPIEPGAAAVLDAVAAHFVASGHDIAALIKLLMLTRAYQRPAGPAHGDTTAATRVAVRPLDAGQAAGALGGALGLRGSADLAGALERAFDSKPGEESAEGAPERPVGDLRRALFLVGGGQLQQGVAASPLVARIARQSASERLDALFRTLLARGPTDEERASLSARLAVEPAADAVADLAWAVCASAEFLTNH